MRSDRSFGCSISRSRIEAVDSDRNHRRGSLDIGPDSLGDTGVDILGVMTPFLPISPRNTTSYDPSSVKTRELPEMAVAVVGPLAPAPAPMMIWCSLWRSPYGAPTSAG